MFITVLTLSANINAKDYSVTGLWLLTKVDAGGELHDVYSMIRFKDDGTVEMDDRVLGKWNYDKKANSVTITSEIIKEFTGVRKVSKLTQDEMVMSDGETTMYYKKINPEQIQEDNENSGLKGSWSVAKKTLIFKLPNELTIIEIDGGMTSTDRGIWMYEPKEKTLTLLIRDRDFKGENSVVINQDEFTINHAGNEISAKKKEQPNVEVEKLKWNEEDFYNQDGDFKYPDDEEKLPWFYQSDIANYLQDVNQLVYTFYKLIDNDSSFDTFELTANVKASIEEGELQIDNIFVGVDRNSIDENQEMVVAYYPEYGGVFPLNSYTLRVTGTEELTTPAGTFACTVIECMGEHDEKIKAWMINDKPGILAKVIKENSDETFGYYYIFELKEIKHKTEVVIK